MGTGNSSASRNDRLFAWIDRNSGFVSFVLVGLLLAVVVVVNILTDPETTLAVRLVVWLVFALFFLTGLVVVLRILGARYTAVARWTNAAGLFMLVVVIAIAPVVLVDRRDQLFCLKIAAIIILSMIPGFIYLQFLAVRGHTLREEYLRNLVRLGLLKTARLASGPQGELSSEEILDPDVRYYLKKFEAVYGRTNSLPLRPGSGTGTGTTSVTAVPGTMAAPPVAQAKARGETLVPMLWVTVIISIGWALLLEPEVVSTFALFPDQLVTSGTPRVTPEALRFGFLGSYFFIVQMLVRRYFQDDLKADAYMNALVRVISTLFIVTVVSVVWEDSWGLDRLSAFAFIVGIFPQLGLDLIRKAIQSLFKGFVPSLDVNYPLSDLDGLNVFYEARLLEEGIEDMQNLASADLVEMMLRTRVPVERVLDWIDQAHLYLRLPPKPPRPDKQWPWTRTGLGDAGAIGTPEKATGGEAGEVASGGPPQRVQPSLTNDRELLRRYGIRSSTGLQDAYGTVKGSEASSDPFVAQLDKLLGGEGLSRTRTILVTLRNEPNLRYVRSWRDNSPEKGASFARSALAADLEALPAASKDGPKPTLAAEEIRNVAKVADSVSEFVAEHGSRELDVIGAQGLWTLALNFRAMDNFEEALKHFELASRADPTNHWPLTEAGVTAAAYMHDHDLAEEFYERALAIAPGDPAIRYNLSCLHARRGDSDGALTLLTEVLGEDPSLRAQAALDAGDGPFEALAGRAEFQALLADDGEADDGGDTDSPVANADDA